MADTVRRAGDAMTTLGIDLGTGSVKAEIVDDDGRVTGRASHPYRVRSPRPGWAEGDPREWLAAAREVAEVAAYGVHPGPTAVGFSGQMHGVVVTDAAFTPLRPAILWADTRATAEAAELRRALSSEDLSRLGSPPVPGFAATTIAWLLRNEPEVMAKAVHVLQPKDWLRTFLGGEIATDPSDASGTLMYDVVSGQWSSLVLDGLGIDRALLPPVLSSVEVVGEVRLGGANQRLDCVVGAADTACALAGLGLRPGDGYVAVGTGAQVVRVMSEPSVDASLRTHTFATAGAPGDGWYRLGAVQSGGLALSAILRGLDATPEEAARALHKGVRPDDPIFVPYLSGERTPFMNPELRGSWHGLSLSTDRPAMLRSVLEGVAQAVALGVDAVQDSGQALPDTVPLIGGGTHHPAFRQLLADASGLSLMITDAPDSAVVGAALLASGRTSNPRALAGVETVTPDAHAARLLRHRRAMMVAYAQSGAGSATKESS
ncbi:MAG: FGGY family carbohydrate kinase [bacterium]|nr:FGGY family carbohydrate kinase [bacterium]